METMKTLNGYEIVDSKARQDIADMKQQGGYDFSNYYTKNETSELIAETLANIEIPEDVATKAYVDNQVGDVEAAISTVQENLDKNTYGFATKTYVDSKTDGKAKGWKWVDMNGSQFLWLTEAEGANQESKDYDNKCIYHHFIWICQHITKFLVYCNFIKTYKIT